MGTKLYGNKGKVVFDEFITCENRGGRAKLGLVDDAIDCKDIPKYIDKRLNEMEGKDVKCFKCASFNKTENRCNMSLRESFTCRAYDNALFKKK